MGMFSRQLDYYVKSMTSDNGEKIDRKRIMASEALKEANNDQWKAIGLLLCLENENIEFEEAFFLIFYPDWPKKDK